jgi:beta-glucosidase
MIFQSVHKLLSGIACLLSAFGVQAQDSTAVDSTGNQEQFIRRLMSEMTLEEKLGQLSLRTSGDAVTGESQGANQESRVRQGHVGGLYNLIGVDKIKKMQRIAVEESRLKIPLLFGLDVIHGYKTIFPVPLGLASTWNPGLVEQSARIAAIEASADGLNWTFSPMVDIARDPRWGRIVEGAGEDPFLGGAMAKAMVRGYQGDNTYSDNNHIMACVKHFALYGAAEAGRDYNTVDMSRIRMFNEYFPPYKAAVEAGAASVMTSFNEVDGIPATGNRWLLTDILRGAWKFKGFVVTDYTAIDEMEKHGTGDLQANSAQALRAGVDMEMVGEGFFTTLSQSLKEGKITEEEIDAACHRILEAKYKLGLFDNPYKYCDAERAKTQLYTSEHRAAARKTAAESFVLLKNDGNLLPLKKQGTIAVVGPLANTRSNMVGSWCITADLDKPATLVEGISSVAGENAKIIYAKGSNLIADAKIEENATAFGRTLGRDNRGDEELLAEALNTVKDADVIIAALGESSEMSGESSSRANLDIPDVQHELLKALLKTGKPVVLALFTGRPLVLTWENEHVPAILNVWFGGSEAAPAIGDVLFGDANPSGKLVATFPKHPGQVPIYYNHKNTGRPVKEGWFEKFRSNYLDVDNEPLYPFGYGLSYTQFAYGGIKLSSETMDAAGEIVASITVTNTGSHDGAEVVQLYIRDVAGSVTRPVKELKGFEKVFIPAGQSREVRFVITPELLKFHNADLEYVCDPGDFEMMIGGNSRDIKTAKFQLLGTLKNYFFTTEDPARRSRN